MNRRSTHVLALLIACTSTALAQEAPPPPAVVPPPAPPPPPGPDPQTKAKLDAQQQALDALAARQAQLEQALAAERQARDAAIDKAKPAPASVLAGGFLQVDAGARQSSQDELKQSGDTLNQDRFSLRRARPKLTATYGAIGGVIELDANTVNGMQVRPSNIEATYQVWPALRAGMGIAKIPFGYEVEESDRTRLFLERSNAERALFPGEYDLGVKLTGAWKFLRYAAAAQNGEPVGEKGGFTLRDPNQAKDITARGGIDVTSGAVRVAGGLSFLTGRGFHAGTPATKDQLVWRDLNEDGAVNAGEIQVIAGQAATPSASFDRFALGADLQIYIDLHDTGKLMLYGEVVAAGNLDRANVIADPIANGRDMRELGYYVAAIDAPAPWALLGARYDHYDPDADASELRTGRVVPVNQTMSTLALTGALVAPHGRLILEWDHNRNHLGRSVAGVPMNLADDALILRAQVEL
ncbi:MAG: hypothetical protein JO257_26945 [Deltaproteobacteria bacterium]|nr:hypothetical protein [Deltaproteobacteria bacterium]